MFNKYTVAVEYWKWKDFFLLIRLERRVGGWEKSHKHSDCELAIDIPEDNHRSEWIFCNMR